MRQIKIKKVENISIQMKMKKNNLMLMTKMMKTMEGLQ